MAVDPKIRASDEDRDKTASLLREHHAVGRLTAEEFNERLDKAYEAKTVGELDALLADLPGIDLYRLPDAALQRGRQIPGHTSALAAMADASRGLEHPHGRLSPAWQAAWGSWFTVSLVTFVIWAIAGFGYPWFLWVAGPWGAILLARWLAGNHPQGGQQPPHRPELRDGGQDQLGGPPSG
jgi:hypothetical protein